MPVIKVEKSQIMQQVNEQITKQNHSDVLSETKVQQLISGFGDYITTIESSVAGAKDIVVSKEDDVDGMKLARERRLAIRKVRLQIEDTRVTLKSEHLAAGKIVDGIATVLKGIIEPAEKHLQIQEDFAKTADLKRKAEIRQRRFDELMLVEAPSYMFKVSLDDVSEEDYTEMLKVATTLKEQRDREEEEKLKLQAAEDAEREKQRLAEEEENERIRKENEILYSVLNKLPLASINKTEGILEIYGQRICTIESILNTKGSLDDIIENIKVTYDKERIKRETFNAMISQRQGTLFALGFATYHPKGGAASYELDLSDDTGFIISHSDLQTYSESMFAKFVDKAKSAISALAEKTRIAKEKADAEEAKRNEEQRKKQQSDAENFAEFIQALELAATLFNPTSQLYTDLKQQAVNKIYAIKKLDPQIKGE